MSSGRKLYREAPPGSPGLRPRNRRGLTIVTLLWLLAFSPGLAEQRVEWSSSATLRTKTVYDGQGNIVSQANWDIETGKIVGRVFKAAASGLVTEPASPASANHLEPASPLLESLALPRETERAGPSIFSRTELSDIRRIDKQWQLASAAYRVQFGDFNTPGGAITLDAAFEGHGFIRARVAHEAYQERLSASEADQRFRASWSPDRLSFEVLFWNKLWPSVKPVLPDLTGHVRIEVDGRTVKPQSAQGPEPRKLNKSSTARITFDRSMVGDSTGDISLVFTGLPTLDREVRLNFPAHLFRDEPASATSRPGGR